MLNTDFKKVYTDFLQKLPLFFIQKLGKCPNEEN